MAIAEHLIERHQVVEKIIRVLEKPVTPRQALQQETFLGENLIKSPQQLNDPLQEIVALNFLKAAERSGIFEEEEGVYFDQGYPRDRLVFDGDNEIREGSMRMLFQTQANTWSEASEHGHVDKVTANFVVRIFSELQFEDKENPRDNIAYLLDVWAPSQKFTQEQIQSIWNNLQKDADAVYAAGRAVKQFFNEERKKFGENSTEPMAKMLRQIADPRADFISCFGKFMIGFMRDDLFKKRILPLHTSVTA